MSTFAKSRLLSLAGACILIGAVACIDSPTAPKVTGKKSVRDTTVIEGDSTLCRNGYVIIGGRIVCRDQ